MDSSSQFRVKGGNGYVKYVDGLLNCSLSSSQNIFQSKDYEFVLFGSIQDMVDQIKLRDSEHGLSRLIAGYAWEWKSKNNRNAYDIEIEETSLQWNSVSDDYINSKNSLDEVGCIHTTQGYDLNYAGIIFGNEITYDEVRNEIVILKDNYFDKNGKMSIANISELKDYIINIYKTIMLRGIKGTYVYVCDPTLREYFHKHMVARQTSKNVKYLDRKDIVPYENSIPVYNLKAAAGSFSDLQTIDDCDWVEIPYSYKPSKDLFACIVIGESMNKVIPNGSLCLFRKDNGGSRNGKIVLVECTNIQDPDSGSAYTVKEYSSKKSISDDTWHHQSIILKPLSYNSEYNEIILSDDELEYFRVVGIFERVL